ncbi:hypothetical protein J4Q44_G00368860, partial [Coregonus suidteri]
LSAGRAEAVLVCADPVPAEAADLVAAGAGEEVDVVYLQRLHTQRTLHGVHILHLWTAGHPRQYAERPVAGGSGRAGWRVTRWQGAVAEQAGETPGGRGQWQSRLERHQVAGGSGRAGWRDTRWQGAVAEQAGETPGGRGQWQSRLERHQVAGGSGRAGWRVTRWQGAVAEQAGETPGGRGQWQSRL